MSPAGSIASTTQFHKWTPAVPPRTGEFDPFLTLGQVALTAVCQAATSVTSKFRLSRLDDRHGAAGGEGKSRLVVREQLHRWWFGTHSVLGGAALACHRSALGWRR